MATLEDLLSVPKKDVRFPPYKPTRHAGDRGCAYTLEIDYRWDAFERPPGRELLEAFRLIYNGCAGVSDRTPIRNVQDGWAELRIATPTPITIGVDREKSYLYFDFHTPEAKAIVQKFLMLLGIQDG